MFDKSKIEAQSTLMSFDDFFPLFCLVFSYAPPSNSIAMGTFLSSIRGIQYEPPLEYARLFLVSAIEFVKNYKVSDLYCKLGAYDSNDPLGFLQN
ncbi:hypothetical protein GPJ56_008156 [Histomonas meleagridis]|uniref:uncharacterized protein n=1 Tax=Histomonas meleagridis TaxID=135588 RepID=UPI003559AC52|nr:hypothetical protein GPJ56_008156 [Histomonas meleagridis]KAH0803104.1 hypothetical protein GO595_004197 [Histomonas meleagridis]